MIFLFICLWHLNCLFTLRQHKINILTILSSRQISFKKIYLPAGSGLNTDNRKPTTEHTMHNLSLGIIAYNEEANIALLLQRVLNQKFTNGYNLKEIFVVAFGCTDRTEDIVINVMKRDERIKLLSQPQREGKASAINLFLSKASG